MDGRYSGSILTMSSAPHDLVCFAKNDQDDCRNWTPGRKHLVALQASFLAFVAWVLHYILSPSTMTTLFFGRVFGSSIYVGIPNVHWFAPCLHLERDTGRGRAAASAKVRKIRCFDEFGSLVIRAWIFIGSDIV